MSHVSIDCYTVIKLFFSSINMNIDFLYTYGEMTYHLSLIFIAHYLISMRPSYTPQTTIEVSALCSLLGSVAILG